MNTEDNLKIEKLLKTHEGLKLKAYLCTAHKWTIGIGRNLEGNPLSYEEILKLYESDEQFFININVDKKNIYQYIQDNFDYFINRGISEEFANYLFLNDVKRITTFFNSVSWYSSLSYVRKFVVIDMMFALGEEGFLGKNGFKDFITALKNNDFGAASRELLDSKWYRSKAKNRVEELSVMIRDDKFPEWMEN